MFRIAECPINTSVGLKTEKRRVKSIISTIEAPSLPRIRINASNKYSNGI